MNDKCEGCRHNIPSSTDFCYMFENQPEELPCGQHDKYNDIRKITGKIIMKNPFMLHLMVTEKLWTVKKNKIFFEKKENMNDSQEG